MASSEPLTAAAGSEKSVMVVGIDDSEHSHYALQWTLDHFFTNAHSCPPLFSLVLVHAKPTPSSVVGLAGPGAADVLPYVESDLRKISARVVDKAKELCISRSVSNVLVEVVEGDARNVLCDAVEKHQATMLVLGSHGYGAIKRNYERKIEHRSASLMCPQRKEDFLLVIPYDRVVLGSVSDYCAHHAHCTVMIVKKPKAKH